MPKNVINTVKNNEKTLQFSLKDEKSRELRETLQSIYDSLKEKGYNPVNQIVGYILSEDPTYITNHNDARALIRRIDRYELLRVFVQYFLHI